MSSLNEYHNADTVSINTFILEQEAFKEREKDINQLKSLGKRVCHLHTNLIYYRNSASKKGLICYDIWKSLIKHVGGIPNGWLELGEQLKIARPDLDYIMNSVQDNKTDVLLKVFMQNENATLDKIVDAFVILERYDILRFIYDKFLDLSLCFDTNDSGYDSKSNSYKNLQFLKNLPNDLPPALNKNISVNDKEPNDPNPPESFIPSKNNEENKNEKDSFVLFLTFTEDGHATAEEVKNIVASWTDISVKVITLTTQRLEIYQNPEKFIRQYFEKADFVVPIITSGYINQIQSRKTESFNLSDNLDYKYVSFIYTLIANHYIFSTGCLNKKVRTVLPQQVDAEVYKSIGMYPDLMPWTHISKFEAQFKAFLKIR